MIEKSEENLRNPSRLLLIFVKEPLPGKVKTRLAASVGMEEAARRYQVLVALLLKQLRGLKDCRVRICYAPDDAEEAVRFWILPQIKLLNGETMKMQEPGVAQWNDVPGGLDFAPQGGGDLGDRLEKACSQGFADGFQKVAMIGSDCVDLGAGWINAAFRRLEGNTDLAIGPSPDGGYGFLGLSQDAPELFRDILWSHEKTLEMTLEKAVKEGLSHELLPELNDIDDADDWQKLMDGFLGEKVAAMLEGT